MTALLVAGVTALWLGILTSISPCPLATNIAAISYLGRQADDAKNILASGFLYTLGRAAAYVVLAILTVMSLLSVPALSLFLQKYMNKALGPILIAVAFVLLDVIRLPSFGVTVSEKVQWRARARGLSGAAPLGALFALTFCPTSAALFFGSLIPIALRSRSVVLLPALYGLGTALPVFVFAVFVALGAKSVAAAFQRAGRLELWARRITGAIFLAIGLYFCWAYIIAVPTD